MLPRRRPGHGAKTQVAFPQVHPLPSTLAPRLIFLRAARSALGVIDVLRPIEEEVFECPCGHGKLLKMTCRIGGSVAGCLSAFKHEIVAMVLGEPAWYGVGQICQEIAGGSRRTKAQSPGTTALVGRCRRRLPCHGRASGPTRAGTFNKRRTYVAGGTVALPSFTLGSRPHTRSFPSSSTNAERPFPGSSIVPSSSLSAMPATSRSGLASAA